MIQILLTSSTLLCYNLVNQTAEWQRSIENEQDNNQ